MSHFTVLVTGEDFNAALAPFIEQEETGYEQYFQFVVDYTEEELQKEFDKYKAEGSPYGEYGSLKEYAKKYHGYGEDNRDADGNYGRHQNPNARWDWYELGGRWSGFLHLKDGAKGYKGGQYFRGSQYPEVTGRADSALKGDIDVEAMRLEAETEARAYATAPLQAIVGLPMLKDWDTIRNLYEDDEARAVYHSQPAHLTSRAIAKEVNDNHWFSIENVIEGAGLKGVYANEPTFTQEIVDTIIEKYVAKQRKTALQTFAVLHDGKWSERGEMGWWAVVHNENPDWEDQFEAFWNSLPDDTRINIVDCHI